ncbi:cation transporter HKT1;3-like [Bidens hawaiensis]|uniref:cation transporter HKT1;3-like n=1 Tax=Bidens hawaiensis TaxID=980011 RepID=UPI00404AA18E
MKIYSYLRRNSFFLELIYFLFIASLGFSILRSLDVKTPTFKPRNLDLFFTCVSAATVTSLSTVEMEVFSNTQLVILTILMLIGGEVFTSMLSLYIRTLFCKPSLSPASSGHLINVDPESLNNDNNNMLALKYKSLKFLSLVVLFYLLCVHLLSMVSVFLYINSISSARDILKQKNLHAVTFSIFTIVSTFSNCGFIPTNENILIFRKNSGLLLILAPQILLGNTFYPPVLRSLIWTIGRFTKKEESRYLLRNSKGLGYHHLLSYKHSYLLVITVLVFLMVQFILLSSMEWSLGSLRDMNVYQKLVGILFQTVNTRHAGESIVDLSTISSAVLVLFIMMMYLPPYTTFLPVGAGTCEQGSKRCSKVMENLKFSQLTYLVIFIIIVCITERKQIVNDPLNFNVLNIVFEVISAYGNVGLSTGYNCGRRTEPNGGCQNKWYGFSGKFSDEGKVVIILVMIFGRLKKFNINGGKAWKLL